MTKNKKSVKKIKELEQKIKENPDVIKVYHNDILVDIIDNKDDKKVDIDKEIEEILKLGKFDAEEALKNTEKEIIYDDKKYKIDVYNFEHKKELEEIYNNINQKRFKGYFWNNQIYKIISMDREMNYYAGTYLNNYNYYISIENIKGEDSYIKFNLNYEKNLLEKLPLSWEIKNFWNKYNPLYLYKEYKVKKDYENDIKEMLYNGGCIKENPFKNKNEYKSSLSDKIKWIGHNLLHCQCSDKEEESCDIDIDEIIKNNSYEGIKEYEKEKDELYKLQGQVRSILEIMDNKEYPLNEYKINEDGTYRPYFSDKWVKRLTELGYDSHLKEDLERFIKDGEKNIRKTLYEIDIKDRRQGRIGD